MTHIGAIKPALPVLLALIGTLSAGAASFDSELHHRIVNTTQASAPYVARNVIMLSYSAPSGTQAVSLAMEHEQYRVFHTYEKNSHGIFVLAMDVPEGLSEIRYRLIVDGLWTVDTKTRVEVDGRGIRVSSLTLPAGASAPEPGVQKMPDGSTRFVYRGSPGSRVFLVGDFNRWDPFLTPMAESPIHTGLYSATLNLPEGSRYYRYIIDGKEITDPGNNLSSRNGWGELASLIR